MNILIDVNHPAHVHYFKNFIWLMEKKKHTILVTARDREMVIDLLKVYNIKYINRGTGANGVMGKMIYLFKANGLLLKTSLKFKPDVFLSFGTPYAAQIAWLLNKPHLAITDNDYAGKLTYLSMVPFSKYIITSKASLKKFGSKHIKVNSYVKLLYLHPKYYQQSNLDYKKYLNIEYGQKYIIVRFVAFNAYHDFGLHTLNVAQKKKLINSLTQYGKVFISSESQLPEELLKYKLEIPPEMIHDVLANAILFIGQSGTMSAEAALLGTPSIFIASENEKIDGVLKDFEENALMSIVRYSLYQMEEIEEAVSQKNKIGKEDFFRLISSPFITSKIDLTEYLINFVESTIANV